MTPEQFDIFIDSNEKATSAAIEKYVNGGLRRMDKKLDDHIARVEPVIKAYEDQKINNETATKYGKRLIFWSQIVGAFGILYIAAQVGITNFITWRP